MKKVLMILVVLMLALPITNAFAHNNSGWNAVSFKEILADSSGTYKTTKTGTWAEIVGEIYPFGSSQKASVIGQYVEFEIPASTEFEITYYEMASSYGVGEVYVDGVLHGSFQTKGAVNKTDTHYMVTGLTNEPHIIKIVNADHPTQTTNEIRLFGLEYKTGTYVNDSVTNLTETHTSNSVNLSWVNPIDTNFTGLIIKKDGIEVAQLANTSSSYSITGLDADTLYNFEVIAKYSDGINSGSQTLSVTTNPLPLDTSPPSNISNVNVAITDEVASFMYALPVDTDFSHLKIYRDGVLKETNFTGTSYDDFSLVQNTTYVYKFVSVDLSGNESNGYVQSVTTAVTVDSTAPSSPVGVEVTNGGSSGSVKWTISNEADVKGYNVYIDGVKHNTSLILANTYVIPNLVNEQNYLITVTSVDTSDNESVPSVAQTLTPTAEGMPLFEAKYDLKDVADGTSQWFGSMWLILAFSVGIPLAFIIARRVKGLLIA